MGTLIASGLYSFESIPVYSDEHNIALSEFRKVQKIYDSIQVEVNSNIVDSKLDRNFKETEKVYKEKLNHYLTIKREERVFMFPSLQYFLGDFGPWLAISCYVLFFSFITFLYLRKFKGLMIVHAIMLMGCVYYMFWIFNQFRNLPKWKFYGMTAITAILMMLGIWMITKYRRNRYKVFADQKREYQELILNSNPTPEQIKELTEMLKRHQQEIKNSL